MRVVRALDETTWRKFVEEQPLGNVFHTPEMLGSFARARGHEPALWAALSEAGRVLALFTPVRVTLGPGALARLTSRDVAYGGPLCVEGPSGAEALKAILDAYLPEARRRVLFTELRNHSDLSALDPVLRERGFRHEPHLTLQVDLARPPDEIFAKFQRKKRAIIRRARRDRRLEVREMEDPAELGAWYASLRKTYARARVPLADPSLFEAAWYELAPKGMARFLVARFDRETIAGALELPYKGVVYGWYQGFDRRFRSRHPNEMLIWEVLQWGARNGFETYDFGGAGRPDESYGARAFKMRFGATPRDFGRYVCVHSPLRMRLARCGYGLYRQARRLQSVGKISRRQTDAVEPEP